MAQLDVEKKDNNDWWKWLLGIIAAIIIIWFIWDAVNDDDDTIIEGEPEPVTQIESNTVSANSIYRV